MAKTVFPITPIQAHLKIPRSKSPKVSYNKIILSGKTNLRSELRLCVAWERLGFVGKVSIVARARDCKSPTLETTQVRLLPFPPFKGKIVAGKECEWTRN